MAAPAPPPSVSSSSRRDPHLLEDLTETAEGGLVGPVQPAGAVPPDRDQPRLAQHAQVLRHRRKAHAELRGDLPDREAVWQALTTHGGITSWWTTRAEVPAGPGDRAAAELPRRPGHLGPAGRQGRGAGSDREKPVGSLVERDTR
jgi:hypothetical protein